MARTVSRLLLAACATTLVLGLAACKKDEAASGPTTSETPVANVTAPAGKAWTETFARTADGGYLMGNPEAPVKVIEYGSLSCPHCAKLAQEGYPTLVNNYVASGRVSLEFRSFAIHPQDVPLTVLAECGGIETFFPLAEELYKNFDAVTERTMKGADAANAASKLPDNQRFVTISDALGFTDFFAARGLSKDQQKACLANVENASQIARLAEKYGSQGIEATPTVLINGSKVEGSTWQEINAALQKAGVR